MNVALARIAPISFSSSNSALALRSSDGIHSHLIYNRASTQMLMIPIDILLSAPRAVLASLPPPPCPSPLPQALYLRSPIRMQLTLRSFLPLLRDLVLIFPKGWNQMTRRLWYILGILRSRILSRNPERRDEVLLSAECRPAKSNPTAVICASQLPPLVVAITEVLIHW